MNEKPSTIRSCLAALKRWLTRLVRVPPGPEAKDAPTAGQLQVTPGQPVGQIVAHEGHQPVAVVDLGRDISVALRASWNEERPFESGGVIESAWLQPLLGAGSTAASSLLAGNVFVATADPGVLMQIKGGFATAVMQGGRIVRHAPFIAAGNAIVPVVAPLMLFTTISSLITGARLDRMQMALGTLSETLARVRDIAETKAYAKLQSAATQLDETWSQFEHSQRFTEGMKLEVVQARRDLNVLHHQFGHLVDRDIRTVDDARTRVSDINVFFLSSLMDIRADVLRLYLTLQDDPGYAGQRQAALSTKVEQCIGTFRTLLDEDPIEGSLEELQRQRPRGALYDPRRWFRIGRGDETPDADAVRAAFEPVREQIEGWTSAFDSAAGPASQQSIVVYRDPGGERTLHARHTTDLRLAMSSSTSTSMS